MRQQRMTMQMLNAVRTNTAKVSMSLLLPTDEETRKENEKYFPPAHEFVYLRIEVTNWTGT